MDELRAVGHALVLVLYLGAAAVPCPRPSELPGLASGPSGTAGGAGGGAHGEAGGEAHGHDGHAAHARAAAAQAEPGLREPDGVDGHEHGQAHGHARARGRAHAHGQSGDGHAAHDRWPAPDAPELDEPAGSGSGAALAWNARCPCGCDERDPARRNGGLGPLLLTARIEPEAVPAQRPASIEPPARPVDWRSPIDPVPI